MDYIETLKSKAVFSDKYDFISVNAKSINTIIARYQEKYQSDSYFLVLIFCDTDKGPSDKKTDEELKKFIHRFHEKDQFLIGECKKYGFKYIDTHKDREKVLNEVFNYICEEMKN